MTSAADKLASELADLRRQVAAISRSAQLGRSSVQVDGEAVRVVDGIRSGVEAKTLATVALSTADGKNKVTYSVFAPVEDGSTVGDIWFKRDAVTRVITASWEWDGSEWQSVTFDDAVLASLTVGKLVSGEIAAGERIISGPENANHAEVTSTGIYVYTVDPDGQVVEAGRFGTNGSDRLLITDGAGQSLASIDANGGASFTRLDVDGDPVFNGKSLTRILDERPRGLLVRGGVETSQPATATSRGSYDVEFLAIPGRAYRISTTTLNVTPSTTATYGIVQIVARRSSEGAPTVATGRSLVAARGSTNIAGGAVPVTLTKVISFAELFSGTVPTVPTKVRVLLAYGVISGGGTVGLFADPAYPAHTFIEDVGMERPFTGVLNDGDGSTAAPVTQYVTNWAATWGANWKSNSSDRRTDQAELIQGYTSYYPAGGVGIGQIGFGNGSRDDGAVTGNFATELAGATISMVAIYVYSTHWHNNSGGTVLLGRHPYTSVPGTKPADWQLNGLASTGHAKPGGKWIYLPASWYGGVASGVTRGFTLGDGVSTSTTYYGRFAVDPTDSRRPVVQIVYTK